MRFENRRGPNEKKRFSIQGNVFFYCSFLGGPLALHFKDDLKSLRRHLYNILNHSKLRRIEKDMLKCLVIGMRSVISRFILYCLLDYLVKIYCFAFVFEKSLKNCMVQFQIMILKNLKIFKYS